MTITLLHLQLRTSVSPYSTFYSLYMTVTFIKSHERNVSQQSLHQTVSRLSIPVNKKRYSQRSETFQQGIGSWKYHPANQFELVSGTCILCDCVLCNTLAQYDTIHHRTTCGTIFTHIHTYPHIFTHTHTYSHSIMYHGTKMFPTIIIVSQFFLNFLKNKWKVCYICITPYIEQKLVQGTIANICQCTLCCCVHAYLFTKIPTMVAQA